MATLETGFKSLPSLPSPASHCLSDLSLCLEDLEEMKRMNTYEHCLTFTLVHTWLIAAGSGQDFVRLSLPESRWLVLILASERVF